MNVKEGFDVYDKLPEDMIAYLGSSITDENIYVCMLKMLLMM